MPKVPTNLEILNTIHTLYYSDFADYSKETSSRDSKIYVPIDVDKVAHNLSVDVDIIFGRLYYDLDRRYGYSQKNGTQVKFFSIQFGKDRHVINFPYMAAVLAELSDENKKFRIATVIALISLVVSIVSIFIATS